MIGINNTQSLNVYEKSRGIIAFAFNTDTTDYVSIAEKTLQLASYTTGLPYTLITNATDTLENTRYDTDTGKFVQWRNAGRWQAYDLSPYDETLLIDIDYLLVDNSIMQSFEVDWDYCLMRNVNAITETFPICMGAHSLPYVWATVFGFRKTVKTKMFMDLVKRIQNNYGYYKALFNVEQGNYRNDYAFAMADIILNGYQVQTTGFPGVLQHVNQKINSIELKDNKFIIRDDNRAYILPKMNLHIMSKSYLQSDNFTQLIDNVTA